TRRLHLEIGMEEEKRLDHASVSSRPTLSVWAPLIPGNSASFRSEGPCRHFGKNTAPFSAATPKTCVHERRPLTVIRLWHAVNIVTSDFGAKNKNCGSSTRLSRNRRPLRMKKF